ncbi:unnamed protein product, partial [Mesorhabditis spiculigera]
MAVGAPPKAPPGDTSSATAPTTNSKVPPGSTALPPPPPHPETMITVNIKSIMQKVPDTKVHIRRDAPARDLHQIVSEKMDIGVDKMTLIYNGAEVRNDEQPLSNYGLKNGANVTVNVKLSSGGGLAGNSRGTTSLVFLLPPMIVPKDVGDARITVRGVNRRPPRAPKSPNPEPPSMNSKQKHEEHEKTRTRMKVFIAEVVQSVTDFNEAPWDDEDSQLVRRTDSSTIGTPSEPVTGELSRPFDMMAASPMQSTTSITSSSAGSPANTPEYRPVTDKELLLYFPCAETEAELNVMRNDLFTPPQNLKELKQIRSEREKACNRRLSLAQQEQKCKCERAFCYKHVEPEQHNCPIDYKNTGRSKIQKENPKVEAGGARKARDE